MIDFGHVILFFFALVASSWAYLSNKRAKKTDNELSELKFGKMVEEVKRESINQNPGVRLDKFNDRYSGKGSGND